jgi:tetratricopeptide (TPR) repeat protein
MLPGTSSAYKLQHSNTIEISGVVFSDDPENKRISGAVVQLCDSDGRVIEERHTGGQGEFVFRVLPGSYTFHLTAEGYEATEFQPGNRIYSDQKLTIYMKAAQPNSSQPSTNSAISAHELSMPRGAREFYASGMKKLYGDKNGLGGLGDFQKALQKAPSFYEAQFQIGMAQLKLGRAEEAEASFRKSVEMSGDKYFQANLALSLICFDKGDLDASKAQFRRALELNPSARSISPKMGTIYDLLDQIRVEQKDYASAVRDLDAYIQREQDDAKVAQARELRKKIQQLIDNQK